MPDALSDHCGVGGRHHHYYPRPAERRNNSLRIVYGDGCYVGRAFTEPTWFIDRGCGSCGDLRGHMYRWDTPKRRWHYSADRAAPEPTRPESIAFWPSATWIWAVPGRRHTVRSSDSERCSWRHRGRHGVWPYVYLYDSSGSPICSSALVPGRSACNRWGLGAGYRGGTLSGRHFR